MSTVWIVKDYTDPESLYVAVAATKEVGVSLLARRIDQAPWETFYDSLVMGASMGMPPLDERLRRDLTEMDDDTILRAWNGYEHGFAACGGEDWGLMSVYPEEVLERADGLPDFIEPVAEFVPMDPPVISHLAEVDGWTIGDHAVYVSAPHGTPREIEVEVVEIMAPSPKPLLVRPDIEKHPALRWHVWVEPQDLSAVPVG